MTVCAEPLSELIYTLPGYDPTPPDDRYYFDEEAAQEAIDIAENLCTYPEGDNAGKNITLEDWQKAFFANLFGWWYTLPDGVPILRYNEVLLFIPRKNTKSTMAAIIGIVFLVSKRFSAQRAQFYCAASNGDQAAIVHGHAKAMIVAEPMLSDLLDCRGGEVSHQFLSIQNQKTKATLRVLSGSAKGKTGKNPSLIIFDELWEIVDREYINAILTGQAGKSFQNKLVIYMTTSDWDRHSYCNETVDYFKRVRDRIVDNPRALPVIYEAPEGADPEDIETWKAANPNWGVSVDEEYCRTMIERARDTPSMWSELERYHLNRRTGAEHQWLDLNEWDKGNDPIPLEKLEGKPCWIGVDLSSTSDLTACACVFRDADDPNRYQTILNYWIPADNMRERERKDRVNYSLWVRQNFVSPIPGNCMEYRPVYDYIIDLSKRYKVRRIGFDRWGATEFQAWLMDSFGDDVVKDFGQGFASMSAPSKELERLVLQGRIQHGGNPVLRWNVSSATVISDPAGNIKPVKPDRMKEARRIDGLVALIMALGLALGDQKQGGSVYNRRGILTL